MLEVELPADARILEFGCGTGALWRENVTRLPENWSVTLTDRSAGMAAETRSELVGSARHFQFGVVDIQNIPFESARFDAVIANHMLYHVPDLAKALSEVCRVLKPGGYLFAATNGDQHMQEVRQIFEAFNWGVFFNIESFRLENGGEILARYFAEVSLECYDDGLVVPEIEPVVAYVLSGLSDGNKVNVEVVERLRERLRGMMAAEGAIRIHKATGIFIARRG
jgi:ubiquinone/menaquinone biosynthesis C-methylase UbiE